MQLRSYDEDLDASIPAINQRWHTYRWQHQQVPGHDHRTKKNGTGSRRLCTGTPVLTGLWMHSIIMEWTTTLQVKKSMALPQAERAYMLHRRSFPSLFLYCFTLCIDALICWQGLCMTIRGTDLDTHHQTTIPISSLSSLYLYKDYPSNMYRMLTGPSKHSRPFQIRRFQYK